MKSFEGYIKNRLTEIVNSPEIRNNVSLIIFKGFTNYALEIIKEMAHKLHYGDFIPNTNPLDIYELSNNAREFLIQLMSSKEKTMICIYEQYLSVADTLNAGLTITDRKIIIVDNNVFSEFYPAVIPMEKLKLLSEYFDSESYKISENIEKYTYYYSYAEQISTDFYAIKYIEKNIDGSVTLFEFINTVDTLNDTSASNINHEIEFENMSPKMWDYLWKIQCGKEIKTPRIVCDEKDLETTTLLSVVSFLYALDVNYSIEKHSEFEEIINNTRTFMPVLKRLHGINSEFRKLNFYKSPISSNETVEISQESIISDIVTQSEKALKGDKSFSNYFITAPTGSGKSLLFQLPAIFLAEEYKAVTIVVTPLIALMKDQVSNLEAKGIHCATFLNSTISYEEREYRSAQIKNGEKSLLYLAPELLLSCPINTLLGERKLGLFVVDEAHTVTSWGRDFRVDYWFLGDYLNRSKKSGFIFPVMCLTATAIYGGKFDVVNETITMLGLHRTKVFLGDVKRTNIKFDIRNFDRGTDTGTYEEVKLKHTSKTIIDYVNCGEKTLVYCPYATQVNELLRQTNNEHRNKIGIYHGQLNSFQKNYYQDNFQKGNSTVMICTKAYGMGIDVKDIKHCYHFAPTGNLSDYIQEIGRIARDSQITGVARIDYSPQDVRYIRVLRGISGLKQFQLKEIIRKLYNIYAVKNHRNLLISPDVFSYMFDDVSLENKVKNGLLLISKDLEEKYGFPVINVRPKTMFTTSYVCVAPDAEKSFVAKYCDKIKRIDSDSPRFIKNSKYGCTDTKVKNAGKIYEVQMSKIWEDEFSELTFADFKRRFFEGVLFSKDEKKQFWPRIKLVIKYKKSFQDTYRTFKLIIEKMVNVFTELKENSGFFEYEEFRIKFKNIISNTDFSFNAEFIRLLFEMFVIQVTTKTNGFENKDNLTFIQKRSGNDYTNPTFRIIGNKHLYLRSNLLRLLSHCEPNTSDNRYISFIPIQNDNQSGILKLLSVLELLDLASYELKGGSKVEIFVRINDPMKLRYLANERYTNNLLRQIEKRHRDETNIVTKFFQTNMSSNERWEFIENYFLGRDEYITEKLGITEE